MVDDPASSQILAGKSAVQDVTQLESANLESANMVWREPAAVLLAAMADPSHGEGQRVLVASLGYGEERFHPGRSGHPTEAFSWRTCCVGA
jgi:hypothetical protein